MTPVTDPALLAQLEGGEAAPPAGLKPVTDPKLLAQLETPDDTGSTVDNLLAGAGHGFMSMARGYEQSYPLAEKTVPLPLKVPMMLGRAVKEKLTGRTPEVVQAEVDEAKRLDAPLLATTAGKIGHLLPTLGAFFLPGAGTYAGAASIGGALGLLEPTSQGDSRLLNTAVGATGGAVGKAVGDRLSAAARGIYQRTVASEAARKVADSGRNAAVAEGRTAGYVVPPTQANPTVVNKTLEGVAGKVSTAQAASAANQEVTNRLAALGLKLPHNRSITPEALATIRKEAGQAYEAVARGHFVADATYKTRLEGLAAAQKKLAEDFPELASKDVLKLAESMNKDSFDGRSLVELTKALREKATVAYRSGETGAARFYKGAAREVEDLMERNIAYTGGGGPNALKEFKEARKLIAKSYAAEAALNPKTGNIDAAKFADALRKGKPLSDEFKTIGEFASAFPKAVQSPTKTGSVLPGSPLDWATAAGISAASGNPMMMASVLARPTARSVLLSKAFQKYGTTPSYGPGVTLRAANAAAESALAKRIAQTLGATGAVEAAK